MAWHKFQKKSHRCDPKGPPWVAYILVYIFGVVVCRQIQPPTPKYAITNFKSSKVIG